MLTGILRVETLAAVRRCKCHTAQKQCLGFVDGYRAKQIEAAYAQCPKTKLVASGYSQGGQIVHNAAKLLPTAVANWISSVVIFGDPGEPLPQKSNTVNPFSEFDTNPKADSSQPVTGVSATDTDIICHAGDDICINGDLVLPPHLTYAVNAASAAAFVVSH